MLSMPIKIDKIPLGKLTFFFLYLDLRMFLHCCSKQTSLVFATVLKCDQGGL